MRYIIIALLLVLTIVAIYFHFKKSRDTKALLIDIALFVAIVIFAYYAKYFLINKLLFITHIALVLVSLWNFYLRLFKARGSIVWILSPILTIALFFTLGDFFRKFG